MSNTEVTYKKQELLIFSGFFVLSYYATLIS